MLKKGILIWKTFISGVGILLLADIISSCVNPPLANTASPAAIPNPTPVATETPSASPPGNGLKTTLLSITNSQGKVLSLEVEVASTPQELQSGLMGRSSLAEMRGMLFDFSLYGDSVAIPFYMKNTYIPLSIAFISGDGLIVDIQSMQPLTETLHYPARVYRYALEVNQGWFDRYGVGVGDRVMFK